MKKFLLRSLSLFLLVVFINNFMVYYSWGAEQSMQKDNLIEKLMKLHPEYFQQILTNPNKYEIQILYTQIDRDKYNIPNFKSFKYDVDSRKYFYPASSVKLSACILALEKMNKINIEGVNKYTPLKIEKSRYSQKAEYKDFSSNDGKPSIANYIKKILVASDNNSFDRLYEFLGQKYFNETLWQKGYKDVLIQHRLGNAISHEENKYTNVFLFYDKNNNIVYQQPMEYNNDEYKLNLDNLRKGKGYIKKGKLINNPKDFSNSNYISIETLQNILKAVIFPEYITQKMRFDLTKDDYEYLRKYMCMLPRQCENPKYKFKDSYAKYFMFGDSSKRIPDNIKIYNKIGCAYGYLIDNAYICDESNGIEFFLTAVIYCNGNGILNDGKYEYYKVGMPFLANLGRVIYKYEADRRNI